MRNIGVEKIIKNDDHVKRFKKNMRALMKDDRYDDFLDDLKKVNIRRDIYKVRKQRVLSFAQKSLNRMSMTNMQARSTLTELKQQIYEICSEIEDELDLVLQYLQSKYAKELEAAAGKTKAGQVTYLHQFFITEQRFVKRYKRLDKIADMFMSDIDQAGRAMYTVSVVLSLNKAKVL